MDCDRCGFSLADRCKLADGFLASIALNRDDGRGRTGDVGSDSDRGESGRSSKLYTMKYRIPPPDLPTHKQLALTIK